VYYRNWIKGIGKNLGDLYKGQSVNQHNNGAIKDL